MSVRSALIGVVAAIVVAGCLPGAGGGQAQQVGSSSSDGDGDTVAVQADGDGDAPPNADDEGGSGTSDGGGDGSGGTGSGGGDDTGSGEGDDTSGQGSGEPPPELMLGGPELGIPNLLPARFGDQQVGTTSPPMAFTVTNRRDVGVTLTYASDDAMFHITDDGCLGTQLASGASCQVSFAFAPTTPGEHRHLVWVEGRYRCDAATIGDPCDQLSPAADTWVAVDPRVSFFFMAGVGVGGETAPGSVEIQPVPLPSAPEQAAE